VEEIGALVDDDRNMQAAIQPLFLTFDRDRSAEKRDQVAEEGDRTAEARDVRADLRDRRAEERERGSGIDTGAAAERRDAKKDREAGANDRTRAKSNRDASDADRVVSATERFEFLVDELTGAHRRAAGLLELEREIVRSTRTNQSFVLAFVDVDGLKMVNDALGHRAGDDLLILVAETVRHHVRRYDLLVRYGGDEFLCGMLGQRMGDARRRFDLVNVELGASSRNSVTVGLAELVEVESLRHLIDRADGDLYDQRRAGRRSQQ
jgi:diguanylate cyclase (GGDEF)-like protein